MPDSVPYLEHEERALLGHALAYEAKQGEFFDGACEDLFFTQGHKRIFRTMRRLYDSSRGVDLDSVITELMASCELEAANGAGYIASLVEGRMRNFDTMQHIGILRDVAAKRQLIAKLERALDSARGGDSAEDVCAHLEQDIAEVESGSKVVEVVALKDFLEDELNAISRERDSKRKTLGIPTGIAALDEVTTGWRPEYTIVGAWPARGKTSFLLQAARAAAMSGSPALIISLEMRKGELLRRLMALEAKVRPRKLRDPREMNISEHRAVVDAGEAITKLPIYICDQDSLDPREIAATARLWIRKAGIRIVFVDFIQVVREHGRDPREVVNKISAGLRSLAKNAKVPVVAASQLSRANAKNLNERPTLFHLKESGNLEQDAHNVLFLYRPVAENQEFTGLDEILVAKQRHGITGSINVFYNPNSLTFEER
jgi:replicative DNA helicase